MKKLLSVLPLLATLALPLAASAHQHASYDIGGTQYDIVIGSLNEPVVVDDKTGLDLRISSGGHMMMAEDGDMEPGGGKPAVGLETALKVELIAGAQKKVLDITPVYGTPGSYKAMFYPTVATTFSYRIFGELNKTPVDLTFTCLAEGSTAKDEEARDISPGVKLLMGGGGFGCPTAKESLGFPEQSASIGSLTDASKSSQNVAYVAGALAILALGVAVLLRRKN